MLLPEEELLPIISTYLYRTSVKVVSELNHRLEQLNKSAENIRRLEFDLQMSHQEKQTIEKELNPRID